LIADASKAKRELGLNLKVRFDELVKIMLDADMRAAGLEPIGEGDKLVAKNFPKRWWGAD